MFFPAALFARLSAAMLSELQDLLLEQPLIKVSVPNVAAIRKAITLKTKGNCFIIFKFKLLVKSDKSIWMTSAL